VPERAACGGAERRRLGAGSGFLRGGDFRREANWGQALADMGLAALHFHDLRHTGTRSPRRAGQVSPISRRGWATTVPRATLIYQHATRDADRRIADALDARVRAERPDGDDDDGAAGVRVSA
jgi:hypothetical protein